VAQPQQLAGQQVDRQQAQDVAEEMKKKERPEVGDVLVVRIAQDGFTTSLRR
jgi:hypothetical protein